MHIRNQGPDFVCIGTQKSGTSWLYENLIRHQDVWMPAVKEIHYFNRVCVNDQLLGNWNTPHPGGIRRYSKELKKLNFKQLRWMRRYYQLGMERSWYLNLFDEKYTGGKVSGDITPDYSTLEERGVKYASEVLRKDIPVIFIIRNPIHRSWSAAKMLMRYRSQSIDDFKEEDLMDLLDKPTIRLCSEYSRIIPLWKKYFNNFHVLSYDELCESPRALLSKISKILDISDSWDERVINQRVWSDEKQIQMPTVALNALIAQYSTEIDVLRTFHECDYAESWYEEMLRLGKNVVLPAS